MKKIAVLGAGAWGTALACVFARKGHETQLFGRNAALCEEINVAHTNAKYLGAIPLPQQLVATNSIEEALDEAGFVFLVAPTQQVHNVAMRIEKLVAPDAVLINCAKGIHRESGLLPSRLLAETVPNHICGVLSGPSFAVDVAAGKPTAVTLAMPELQMAIDVAGELSGPEFRIYASDDVTGVEVGGALKNIIAIAVGICRGMDMGTSAEAALIARGNAEILRFATVFGAKPKTMQGLAGLGDLFLTCSSLKSRNFSYGVMLGQRETQSPHKLAEGVHTVGIAAQIARERGIEAPIIDVVSQIIANTITLEEARMSLLSRPVKAED
ncbi:MAG: NAD(P)-dependent glycerol-3-phosphate dehydrogenase [Rhizobiaceae bacterium]|nr:NAD(P)-dependent glycerol-3-phosphate dehydrogenase [Rhizobiaceae bacterium]